MGFTLAQGRLQILKTISIPEYMEENMDISAKEILGNTKIICPFHIDSLPSMEYHPETDTVHCYGCGANGDVIAVHMYNSGFHSYRQSLFDLAKKFDIEINTLDWGTTKDFVIVNRKAKPRMYFESRLPAHVYDWCLSHNINFNDIEDLDSFVLMLDMFHRRPEDSQ